MLEVMVSGGLHEGAHGSQRRREGVGGEERTCEAQREARSEIGVGEGFKEVKRGLRGGWFVREEELFRGDRRDCRGGRQLACLGDAPLGTADRIIRHLRHNTATLFVHGLGRSVCQCRGWRVGTEHRVGENLGEFRQVGGLGKHQNALAEVVSKTRFHQLLVLAGQRFSTASRDAHEEEAPRLRQLLHVLHGREQLLADAVAEHHHGLRPHLAGQALQQVQWR